jgi:hypothetical protein
MGASKRIARPCLKSTAAAGGAPGVPRDGAPGTTAVSFVRGGGQVLVAGRVYRAERLGRYDGQRVTALMKAGHVMVFLGTRLICRAVEVPPDENASGVPSIVPRPPSRDGGRAGLNPYAGSSLSGGRSASRAHPPPGAVCPRAIRRATGVHTPGAARTIRGPERTGRHPDIDRLPRRIGARSRAATSVSCARSDHRRP